MAEPFAQPTFDLGVGFFGVLSTQMLLLHDDARVCEIECEPETPGDLVVLVVRHDRA